MAAKNVKSNPVKKVDKPDERKKALDTVLTQIEKDFGEGTVMKLGENSKMSVEAISTGSISLDMALGIGGVPKGRIVEIYGPESSGKTTVALHVVAEAQKSGGTAAFIDVEHALDPVYAKALGIDIDSLLVSQPDCGEDALEITEALVRSGAIDVVVVDSVAALVTRNELEGKMEDSNVGQQARLMSKALRKLTSVISRSNCVVIFINQLRDKIGVMFGSPETTTGGKALKYYASVRIDIRKMESLKSNGDIVATHTRAKVVKNKVAPPFRSGEFDIIFGEGISKEGELVDLGVQFDIIQKSGAWFSYGEDRIAQGRDNAKKYLKDHPEIAAEVEAKIRECMGGVSVGDEIAPAPAEEKPIEKKPEEPTENISIDIVVD